MEKVADLDAIDEKNGDLQDLFGIIEQILLYNNDRVDVFVLNKLNLLMDTGRRIVAEQDKLICEMRHSQNADKKVGA